MMAKVFIGMPVYNGERFIRDALDSLIAQDFTDWELLIADNASSDLTGEICSEYAALDKRISYVRHEVNQGVMFNFNYLLEKAGSEFFMWAASDDIWEKEFLSECVNLLVSYPERSVAFGEIVNVDTFNRPYRNEKSQRSFSLPSSCLLVFRFIMDQEVFGKANMIYGLHRLPIIREVMKLPFDLTRHGCDCAINLAVLARGGGAVSEKTIFRKRNARNTDVADKVDYVKMNVARPCNYESTNIVDYYLPNAFVALRGTRYLKCLYWALPIRFIRIYSAVWFNSLRGWIVKQRG